MTNRERFCWNCGVSIGVVAPSDDPLDFVCERIECDEAAAIQEKLDRDERERDYDHAERLERDEARRRRLYEPVVLAALVLAGGLATLPSPASARCFSVWHYKTPQHCGVGGIARSHHLTRVVSLEAQAAPEVQAPPAPSDEDLERSKALDALRDALSAAQAVAVPTVAAPPEPMSPSERETLELRQKAEATLRGLLNQKGEPK